MNGGTLVARTLQKQGVKFVFTLCGGHISPILVESKKLGIRIIDVRHEVNAVFAADAVSRLSGIPGVAVVTAGPGLTNTITAVKNAYLAQSPLILLGGASATILKGRGSLQDIDQMSLLKPHVKYAAEVKRVKNLVPELEKAFRIAQEGVPGPVFVECPIDLLFPEAIVKKWHGAKSSETSAQGLTGKATKWYINHHIEKVFKGVDYDQEPTIQDFSVPQHSNSKVKQVAEKLKNSKKPVMLIGSQATLPVGHLDVIAESIKKMGVPVYLSGMARGLLGQEPYLQIRHKRRIALKEADFVLLAGVPCDFRLDYGNHIRSHSTFISLNRSKTDLKKNRRPDIGVHCDPGMFLKELSNIVKPQGNWAEWVQSLRDRDNERETDINQQAARETENINPIAFCRKLEKAMDENSVIVADGGDFVGTAAYILHPRGPLTWLDPGVFGTLGVGAGFALGAKLCKPDSEVWIIWGDGSSAYSIAEFDTFARHGIPVIGVVGNDGSWAQIARDQIEILGDDVSTVLEQTDYHVVAKGYGADGARLDNPAQIEEVLAAAKAAAKAGKPFLVNTIIGKTDFRKGSISV